MTGSDSNKKNFLMCLLTLLCKKVHLKIQKFYHFKRVKIFTDIYTFLGTVTNVPSFKKILENVYVVTSITIRSNTDEFA